MKKPDEYIKEAKKWAAGDEGVLALGLIGSHARKQARPDSDIDFIIICDNPLSLLNDISWINRFGESERHSIEPWGLVTSIRVFYADGQEVEFGITSKDWAGIPIDEGTRKVVNDGMEILYDPACLLASLQKAVSGR